MDEYTANNEGKNNTEQKSAKKSKDIEALMGKNFANADAGEKHKLEEKSARKAYYEEVEDFENTRKKQNQPVKKGCCPYCEEKEGIIKKLQNVNLKLQENVIDLFQDLKKGLIVNATRDTDINVPQKTPEVGEAVGDKVHLGRGVFIDKDAYHWCFNQSKSGSSFVKELALAVFGPGTLSKSSVSGKATNRIQGAVAKPALNPTKIRAICDTYELYLKKMGRTECFIEAEAKKVTSYITSKIGDMNRERKPAKMTIHKKKELKTKKNEHNSSDESEQEYLNEKDDESLDDEEESGCSDKDKETERKSNEEKP